MRNEKVISSSSIILCVPHRQRKEQWALGSSVVYNNRQRKEQLVFTWNYTCAVHQYTIGKERRSWLSRGTTHAQFSRIQQQAKKGGDGCHVALRMRCSVEYYTGKRRSSWFSCGTTHAHFSTILHTLTYENKGAVGFHWTTYAHCTVQQSIAIDQERSRWLSRGTTHAQFSRIQQQAKKGGGFCDKLKYKQLVVDTIFRGNGTGNTLFGLIKRDSCCVCPALQIQ